MSFEFSSYQSIRYMVYATIVDAFSLKVSARLPLQVAPSLVLYALPLWVKTFGRWDSVIFSVHKGSNRSCHDIV